MVDRFTALEALKAWIGFREGPNNDNPFGAYQGIPNAAYCESFADGELTRTVGYDHRIGLTTSHTQFGAKGDAYTPWGVAHAKERGEWVQDEASKGRPCDLAVGDQVFFAWNDGEGPEPDHVETVVAVYDDLTYDTIGANTGSPNGVWCPIRRDRFYLLGRRRPQLYYAKEDDMFTEQDRQILDDVNEAVNNTEVGVLRRVADNTASLQRIEATLAELVGDKK